MEYDRRIENPLIRKLRGKLKKLTTRYAKFDVFVRKGRSLASALGQKLNPHKILTNFSEIDSLRAAIKEKEAVITKHQNASNNYRERLLKTEERYRNLKSQLNTNEVISLKAKIDAKQANIEKYKTASKNYRERLLNTQERYKDMRELALGERKRIKQTRDERNEAKKLAAERAAAQLYFEDLMNNVSETDSILNFVRRGSEGSGRILARSFSHWLYQQAEKKEFGAICIGTYLIGDELYESSLCYFTEAGFENVWDVAPIELMSAILGTNDSEGIILCENWTNKQCAENNQNNIYLALKTYVKFGKYKYAKELCRILLKLCSHNQDLNQEQLQDLAWFKKMLIDNAEENQFDNDGYVNIAVMDYKLIDRQRTSSNRGDYVQTLAALSNILRFQDVEYVGNSELEHYLNDLKNDVHDEKQIKTTNGNIKARAFPLDRDFASGRNYPENTWLLCNGWFMHRNYKGEIDFPFPDSINPIYISFHLNDPSVLTQRVADELKKSAPIGCRDWTTVYRLREMGVSSFFSGCLTTTVGQILPKAEIQEPKNKLALVESRISKTETDGMKVDEFSQVGDYVRDFSLVEGIKDANQMLCGYLPYSKIKTSRLHCYLPCRSMGFEVDFKPRNQSDIRFEGLLELSQEKFLEIRTQIENKLEVVYKAIFEHKKRDEVMEIWRSICEPAVQAADKYLGTFEQNDKATNVCPELIKGINVRKFGPNEKNAVHLAFASDENLIGYFPTVLQSVIEHTSRPLVVHFMYRGIPVEYLDALPKAFPSVTFNLYDMEEVDYGDKVRMLKHTTVSTMDRCLLPEILKDQKQVVYLDIDILVKEDVSILYDLELDDYFVAGKLSNLKSWSSVVKLVTRGSLFLDPHKAWEMRRALHHQHSLYETTFNAGVIVMNLDMMRQLDFSGSALDLISNCHLNDQDVLNIFGASRVLELDPDWNYVPAQDYCTTPKIVHWAGTVKSWSNYPILWKNEFIETASRAPEVAGYTWRNSARNQ